MLTAGYTRILFFQRRLVFSLFLASLLWSAVGQAQVIETVIGRFLAVGRQGVDTPLGQPRGIVVDLDGNLIIADHFGQTVWRWDRATGRMDVLAGGGTRADDGLPIPGRVAALDGPSHPAVDSAGNVYFTDTNTHRLRRINPERQVVTVAGNGLQGFRGEGSSASSARLFFPAGAAVDGDRNLYVADVANHRIRRVDSRTGVITTIAGTGNRGYSGDTGPGVAADLNSPQGIAVDPAGERVYFSDRGNFRIRQIDLASGVIETVVGTGKQTCPAGLSNDPRCDPLGDGGPAVEASVNGPLAVSLSPGGDLLIADSNNHRVRKVVNGIIESLVGANLFFVPFGVAEDAQGNVFFADTIRNSVFRIDADSARIERIVGSSDARDGSAREAVLNGPGQLSQDAAGNVYIADLGNFRVRKFSPRDEQVTTVAGNGQPFFFGPFLENVPAADSIAAPDGVFSDDAGNVWFTEASLHRVRRVDKATGLVETVAGTLFGGGFAGDGGPATAARLLSPRAVAVDSIGDMYIADTGNHRVRKVEARSGIISTVAGTGVPGHSGDNLQGFRAQLTSPQALVIQGSDLLIAEGPSPSDRTAGHIIRRLNLSTGRITTAFGAGVRGYVGDGGPAELARLNQPNDLALSAAGDLLISDGGNNAIRRISDASGLVTTIAGNGEAGFIGDGGLATLSRLFGPSGVTAASDGRIYISDRFNNRLRVVDNRAVGTALRLSRPGFVFSARQGSRRLSQPLRLASTNAQSLGWLAEATTESGGDWLSVTPPAGFAPASLGVVVETAGLAPGSYSGSIQVRAPGAVNMSETAAVELTIEEAQGPLLGVSPGSLIFSSEIDGDAQTSAIALSNAGTEPSNWAAVSQTFGPVDWLEVTPASGVVEVGAASAAEITVDPAGLQAGTHAGRISFLDAAGGDPLLIEVSLAVAAPAALLRASRQGFSFRTTAGSLATLPQDFFVVNQGQGAANVEVDVILQAGEDWLSVVPQGAGPSVADSDLPEFAPRFSVEASPAGLGPGLYTGTIVVRSQEASNSPLIGIALMQVNPVGTPPEPVLNQSSLSFDVVSGAGRAETQMVMVGSTGGSSLSFSASSQTESGEAWLGVTPDMGRVPGSATPSALAITVDPGALSPGFHRGTVAISAAAGEVQEIAVLAVVQPGPEDPPCDPISQAILPRLLGNNFAVNVGWPIGLSARIVDNCNQPVTAAAVQVEFSAGTALFLQPLRAGEYAATWNPGSPLDAAEVRFRSIRPPLSDGEQTISGSVGSQDMQPVVLGSQVLNQASGRNVLAPGSLFVIRGERLAASIAEAGSGVWPEELAGVSVVMGPFVARLSLVSPTEIRGQVPFELAGESTAQALILLPLGGFVSANLQLADSQPGIFTVDGSESGEAVAFNQAFNAVGLGNKARVGELITVEATGLGALSEPLQAGEAAGENPPSVVEPVEVLIGGMRVAVETQTAAPGKVGRYNVRFRIPVGVAAEDRVGLQLIQGEAESNRATIAVRR